MPKWTWMTLAIGMILVAAGLARAQTYDPRHPICLQTYGIDGGYIDCSFVSLAQCALSAGGRAAQCLANPYFAHAGRNPPADRRQRGIY
jgi:Protein of unknown function (DUF3551)